MGEQYDEDYDKWCKAGCPSLLELEEDEKREEENRKAKLAGHKNMHAKTWANSRSLMGIRKKDYGKDAEKLGLVAYIDGSTGFKHGKISGCAYYFMGKYMAYPFIELGTNKAEGRSYTMVIDSIRVRPLLIVTDSMHVQRYKDGKLHDVSVEWRKRRSCPELELVDTLAKLAACTNQRYNGITSDVVSLEKEFSEMLERAYSKHYGFVPIVGSKTFKEKS